MGADHISVDCGAIRSAHRSAGTVARLAEGCSAVASCAGLGQKLMRSDSRQLETFLQAHQVVPETCVFEEAVVANFGGLHAFFGLWIATSAVVFAVADVAGHLFRTAAGASSLTCREYHSFLRPRRGLAET